MGAQVLLFHTKALSVRAGDLQSPHKPALRTFMDEGLPASSSTSLFNPPEHHMTSESLEVPEAV